MLTRPVTLLEFPADNLEANLVTAEFQRITTVQLEPKLMSSLDPHTPKLLTLFCAKGGALGQRLKTEMELLKDGHCSVDMTREVVIRFMIEFLGEHAGDQRIQRMQS
ncbi:hypothetical protein IRJ41_001754 [Triplophysa rosa]|uniref:Uncharacterized protein n=1 Tax=Triplophysa rosa TaxID=992332 RepID=A0A9W7WLV8_TRIRA|nr:hypothetical protein IRJ41_001754 [Triplophysa rosa]